VRGAQHAVFPKRLKSKYRKEKGGGKKRKDKVNGRKSEI